VGGGGGGGGGGGHDKILIDDTKCQSDSCIGWLYSCSRNSWMIWTGSRVIGICTLHCACCCCCSTRGGYSGWHTR
jgi:hypothetical protein